MRFQNRFAAVCALTLAVFPARLAAQDKDFTLASCSRGDWAAYSIAAEYPATPALNSTGRRMVRFVADTGPDSVHIGIEGTIAGTEMSSADILNKNIPFEPISGLSAANVTLVKESATSLTVNGKKYACTMRTRRIDRPLALERGVLGLRGTSTVWTSSQAPLGLVKMVNDLETLYSDDYAQRCVETWTFTEGGFKNRTEGVETGPGSETFVFSQDSGETSLMAGVLSQTADYIDTVNAKDEAEEPLRSAIANDDVAALKRLVAAGLDPVNYVFSARTEGEGNMFLDAFNAASFVIHEKTLLMEAAAQGSVNVVKYLVDSKKAPVNRRSQLGESGGFRMTDEDPELGLTALYFAVTDDLTKASPQRIARKAEVARFLLSRGADVNLFYRDGDLRAPAIVWAIKCQIGQRRWNGMIPLLLEAGAEADSKIIAAMGDGSDDSAVTGSALIAAVEAGVLADVKALVAAGAPVNAETILGMTAYDYAKTNAENSKECAEILRYLEGKGAKAGSFTRMLER